MADPRQSSKTPSLVRHFLIPVAVVALGVVGFVFASATKAHHRHCERVCELEGQRYTWPFTLAPAHVPPCQCAPKN